MRGHQAASGRDTEAETKGDYQTGQDDSSGVQNDKDGRENTLCAATSVGNRWTEATSERIVPAPTSHVALLKKELKVLETQYFRTRRSLETTTDKNTQFRREMKKVLGQNAKLKREVAKLRHLMDRIQCERKAIEQQASSHRNYIKKIEHCFFMDTKGKALAQCNRDLSSEVRLLQASLEERTVALETTQQELEATKDKLSIVQRAFETRLDALVINGSLHTGLLYEMSKLQDHSKTLARQLDHKQSIVSTLQTELQSSLKCQEELDDTRTVREIELAVLEKERAAFDDKMAQLSGDVQTAACEKATLLCFIHEQAEAQCQLEARLQATQAHGRQKRERIKHKLKRKQDENQELTKSVQMAQKEMERQRVECERGRAVLCAHQEDTLTCRRQVKTLQLEVTRLGDAHTKLEQEYRAIQDVHRELQATVKQHEDTGHHMRSEIETLESTRQHLRAQLDTKVLEERALRDAMEGALQDLTSLSKQRDDAARAMNEAVSIRASLLKEQQLLVHHVDAQRSQLEKLQRTTTLQQNALVHQVAALRKQLQLERQQRIDAEARLKHMKSPMFGAATARKVLAMTQAADQHTSRETADEDAPHALPSAPLPSSAPFPPCMSTPWTAARCLSSSSSSTSSSEDACEVRHEDVGVVQQGPRARGTRNDETIHVSLLQLAEDSP